MEHAPSAPGPVALTREGVARSLPAGTGEIASGPTGQGGPDHRTQESVRTDRRAAAAERRAPHDDADEASVADRADPAAGAGLLAVAAQVQVLLAGVRAPANAKAPGTAAATPGLAALRPATDPATTATIAARKAEAKAAPARREAAHVADTAPTPAPAAQHPNPSFTAATADVKPAPAATAASLAPPAPLPPLPPAVDVAGGILRSAAHLKVEVGALGAVDLHLRVRDGGLHLRVDGEAAHLVEGRQAELSRALAGEGLRLASVELPNADGASLQGGGAGDGQAHGQAEHEGRRQGWEQAAHARDAPPQGPRTARAGSAARSVHDGSIDVQA